MKNKKAGFTIVELLIVIVVVGILATLVLNAFRDAQTKAKVSRANHEMAALAKAINIARANENKTLYAITGNQCTRCSDQAAYELTLDKIGVAAGTNLSGFKAGNPWGNKYWIDENEGENGGCLKDLVTPGTVPTGVTGLISPTIPLQFC